MGSSFMSAFVLLWAVALGAQLSLVQRQASLTVLLLGLVVIVYRSGRQRTSTAEAITDTVVRNVEGTLKSKAEEKRQRGAPTDAIERLLFPLAMLSEKAHLTPIVTAHSPSLVYGSCLLSYLSVQPYKDAKKDGSVLIGYIATACGVLFFITRNYFFVGGIVAHASIGLLVEKPLSKLIPSGEAHLVGQFVGMVASGIAQNDPLEGSLTVEGTTQSTTPSMHVASVAALLTGWLTIGTMFAIRRYTKVLTNTTASNTSRTAVFVAVVHTALFVAYAFTWAKFSFQVSPALWAYHTIFLHDVHVIILSMWAVTLAFGLTMIAIVVTFPDNKIPLIIRRKLFHGLAVALFLPPVLLHETHYLSMGISAALGIMLLVECARLSGTWFSRSLNAVLAPVIDSKDGTVVRTHLYLLWGCGMTFFMDSRERYSYYKEQPSTNATTEQVSGFYSHQRMIAIMVIPGIIQLGIGDAFAAIVGTWYGKTKWASLLCSGARSESSGATAGQVAPGVGGPNRKNVEQSAFSWLKFTRDANEGLTRKSLEGSAAALIGVLVNWLLLAVILGPGSDTPGEEATAAWWWHGSMLDPVVIIGLVFGVIVETVTPGTDNLIVPLCTFGIMHLASAWF